MSSLPVALRSCVAFCSAFLSIESGSTSHPEKLVSSVGALLGILVVMLLSLQLAEGGGWLVLASVGASAVLLFVVPHGSLSQPWALLGGHLVSAAVGVACRLWLPDAIWMPAAAVALAIAAMQYLRCVHPPGGATALAAATGGPEVLEAGFAFLWNPVLPNVLAVLVLALLFNNLFPWRRYPAQLFKREAASVTVLARTLELTQEDFEAARQQLDTYVDLGTEELIELVELARQHAEAHHNHPARILPGHCYSNGRLGRYWSVRQVLDAGADKPRGKGQLIYKTLAGMGAWETGICAYEDFRQWARFEVQSCEGRWVKVRDGEAAVQDAA